MSMRLLFRSFWRMMYRNPEFLKYSGTWDTKIVQGYPQPAEWYDLKHWVKAFRAEMFMFSRRYDV